MKKWWKNWQPTTSHACTVTYIIIVRLVNYVYLVFSVFKINCEILNQNVYKCVWREVRLLHLAKWISIQITSCLHAFGAEITFSLPISNVFANSCCFRTNKMKRDIARFCPQKKTNHYRMPAIHSKNHSICCIDGVLHIEQCTMYNVHSVKRLEKGLLPNSKNIQIHRKNISFKSLPMQ